MGRLVIPDYRPKPALAERDGGCTACSALTIERREQDGSGVRVLHQAACPVWTAVASR